MLSIVRNCLEISIETLGPGEHFFAEMVYLWIHFLWPVDSVWLKRPAVTLHKFLFSVTHTHTHTHEEVTKNLSETSMEFFKETTGNFFGSSNVVPFSVGWLHRSESTLALLGTVSISVQPFVLFLNSIFRSYIPPF